MRTLHPDVEITSDNNLKKKPETVLCNNKTKAGIDVIDQMTRNTLYKLPAEGGPFICFTIIDLALIKSWIFF